MGLCNVRALTKWGCGTILVGLLAWLVGFIGNRQSDDAKGANIGAGLLQFAGVVLLAVGVVLTAWGLLHDKRLSSRRDASNHLSQ